MKIDRTPAAEAVYQDLIKRAEVVKKTIKVNGKEVITPVTVFPAFDPRLIMAEMKGPLHDVLNINPQQNGMGRRRIKDRL